MGLLKDFRDFAMKGNVIDLAVGVIIGAAFGGLTKSMVDDILMPPIGKLVGNLDFSNLYISLSDKIDSENARRASQVVSTATTQSAGTLGSVENLIHGANRLPLAEAKALGPVIAYGNFITLLINFVIVAFCVFIVVRIMSAAQKRFDREKAAEAAAPAVPPADVVLLTEIRDLLKQSPR